MNNYGLVDLHIKINIKSEITKNNARVIIINFINFYSMHGQVNSHHSDNYYYSSVYWKDFHSKKLIIMS